MRGLTVELLFQSWMRLYNNTQSFSSSKTMLKGQTSAFIKSTFESVGIRVIEGPPSSPDLNSIETLWDDNERLYPRILPRRS